MMLRQEAVFLFSGVSCRQPSIACALECFPSTLFFLSLDLLPVVLVSDPVRCKDG